MQKLFKRIISTLTAIVVICACVLPVQAKIDGNGALVYKSDNSSTFDPGGDRKSTRLNSSHSH